MTYVYVLDCFNMTVLVTVFLTVMYLYGTRYCVYNYDVPVSVPVPVHVTVPVPGTKKADMTYGHDL